MLSQAPGPVRKPVGGGSGTTCSSVWAFFNYIGCVKDFGAKVAPLECPYRVVQFSDGGSTWSIM
jgi:hypothetical protein